jgi:hypothetical protein
MHVHHGARRLRPRVTSKDAGRSTCEARRKRPSPVVQLGDVRVRERRHDPGRRGANDGLGYNISNNLFYFDLGLEHTCAKFGFGSGSFYDVENGPRCNNANGMFIRFGPNNVFLEFMQGGLWRYYEADWADNFWQKCPNASSDFSPEWFGDPHSGLIS